MTLCIPLPSASLNLLNSVFKRCQQTCGSSLLIEAQTYGTCSRAVKSAQGSTAMSMAPPHQSPEKRLCRQEIQHPSAKRRRWILTEPIQVPQRETQRVGIPLRRCAVLPLLHLQHPQPPGTTSTETGDVVNPTYSTSHSLRTLRTLIERKL